MTWYLILLLFILGVWGMIRKDNLIKKVIAFNIFNSSLIMLFIYLGYSDDSTAPILLKGVSDIVDPLPQALMLTTIVIGICLTALALAIILKIFRDYGTLSTSKLEKILKKDA